MLMAVPTKPIIERTIPKVASGQCLFGSRAIWLYDVIENGKIKSEAL